MKTKVLMPAAFISNHTSFDVAAAEISAKILSCGDAGADGILLADQRDGGFEQEEELITFLKDLSEKMDTPLIVSQNFERFEDIKKIIYAGAAKVVVNPLTGGSIETLKEGVARFDADNVWGTFWGIPEKDLPDEKQFKQIVQQSGCKIWLLTGLQRDIYKNVIQESKLSVMCAVTVPDAKEEAELLCGEDIYGILYLNDGFDIDYQYEKKELNAVLPDSIHLKIFESAMPFSEFKTNSDGLVPVIVQDYKTEKVLMLAYMNEESYNETIRSGRMTYYSRSRKCLWKKGETSGHYQFVKSLDIDCDCDTILAKVRQLGAACHTGNESCFYTNLAKKQYDDVNPSTILQEIMATVLDRKEHPKEGSYTNYLFDKGIDKILKKVGEEATEIVIAAKNPDASELKYEISDFLYHMIVLMVQKGVSWDEISAELAKRH